MKTADGIPIIGAVSLDNEFTREYVNAMKDFHKTFKPLPQKKSSLNKDEIPILGAMSLDNEITRAYVNDMKEFHKTFNPLPKKEIMPAYKEPSKRKTRKGLKHRLQNSLVSL